MPVRVARAVLCSLLITTAACGAGIAPQTPEPKAASYVRSAPPYSVGPGTADMTSGLAALAKRKPYDTELRDGAVFSLRGSRGEEADLLVLLMRPGANDVPGFRFGFMNALGDFGATADVRVEDQPVYTVVRADRAGAVWFDGDFILFARSAAPGLTLDVVRAVILGRRAGSRSVEPSDSRV